jgi:hypothetical protein
LSSIFVNYPAFILAHFLRVAVSPIEPFQSQVMKITGYETKTTWKKQLKEFREWMVRDHKRKEALEVLPHTILNAKYHGDSTNAAHEAIQRYKALAGRKKTFLFY